MTRPPRCPGSIRWAPRSGRPGAWRTAPGTPLPCTALAAAVGMEDHLLHTPRQASAAVCSVLATTRWAAISSRGATAAVNEGAGRLRTDPRCQSRRGREGSVNRPPRSPRRLANATAGIRPPDSDILNGLPETPPRFRGSPGHDLPPRPRPNTPRASSEPSQRATATPSRPGAPARVWTTRWRTACGSVSSENRAAVTASPRRPKPAGPSSGGQPLQRRAPA